MRVGHCQALIKKTPVAQVAGVFLCLYYSTLREGTMCEVTLTFGDSLVPMMKLRFAKVAGVFYAQVRSL